MDEILRHSSFVKDSAWISVKLEHGANVHASIDVIVPGIVTLVISVL